MHKIPQNHILIDNPLLQFICPLDILRPYGIPKLQRPHRVLIPLPEMLNGDLLDGIDVGREQMVAILAILIQYLVYSMRVICGEEREAIFKHPVAALLVL